MFSTTNANGTIFLTDSDPALQAHTFIKNDRLAAALARIAQRNTPAPVISGAETDGTDDHDPFADSAPSEMTNSETNRHYLRMHDWQPEYIKGLGEVWSDPISGGSHRIAVAVGIEDARAQRDAVIDDVS